MSKTEHEMNSVEIPSVCDNAKHECATPHGSRPHSLIQHFRPQFLLEQFRTVRKAVIDSNVISVCLLLLAMPTLGMAIQIGLFLFGKTCSPFPMWFSFLVFSALALLIHWKCLLKFWGLVFLGLVLTAYTFSDHGIDSELYHIPMQLLLKEGWNPVFDSTIEKFCAFIDPSSLRIHHTLFLPKTVSLCGALVAQSTGLWIADSFLGYVLLFVLIRTSFVFAERIYKCNKKYCLLFSFAVSFCTQFSTMLDGLIDFHTYAALTITILSLVLYLHHRDLHDYILAILATVICCTTKMTGVLNCVVLWGLFSLYSWKHKETYWGILAVTLLIAWIGMNPFVTSWIQYGSPFYPMNTFDPKMTTMDLTYDFLGNADGERMGRLARFVYAWGSPALATKACAIFYHKADFQPLFDLPVTRSVGGFGNTLNFFFCCSIVLIFLSKKNLSFFMCLFVLATLVIFPVKYIGYERYFPQAWTVVPLGIYQFCFFPPEWLGRKNKLKKWLRYGLLFVCFILVFSSCSYLLAYQMRSMIMESARQTLLASYRKDGICFEIPKSSLPEILKSFTISRRLSCGGVDYVFSEKVMDMRGFRAANWHKFSYEDGDFRFFKQYYITYWQTGSHYHFWESPVSLLRRWNLLRDIFKYFPHPRFYPKARMRVPESPIQDNMSLDLHGQET